eukprot:3865563-Prymnesium_polylepis.2
MVWPVPQVHGDASWHSISPSQHGWSTGQKRLAPSLLQGDAGGDGGGGVVGGGGLDGGDVGGGDGGGGSGGGGGNAGGGGRSGGGDGGRQTWCMAPHEASPWGEGSTNSARPAQHGTDTLPALVDHWLTAASTVQQVESARHIVRLCPQPQGSASWHSVSPAQQGPGSGNQRLPPSPTHCCDVLKRIGSSAPKSIAGWTEALAPLSDSTFVRRVERMVVRRLVKLSRTRGSWQMADGR